MLWSRRDADEPLCPFSTIEWPTFRSVWWIRDAINGWRTIRSPVINNRQQHEKWRHVQRKHDSKTHNAPMHIHIIFFFFFHFWLFWIIYLIKYFGISQFKMLVYIYETHLILLLINDIMCVYKTYSNKLFYKLSKLPMCTKTKRNCVSIASFIELFIFFLYLYCVLIITLEFEPDHFIQNTLISHFYF